MTEISHTASPHGPHAGTIDRGSPTSGWIDPPREARLRQDTVAMDWRRLRTIVDALLCRAAGSQYEATAIATPRDRAEELEPTHG
jgi:hypothetical protein